MTASSSKEAIWEGVCTHGVIKITDALLWVEGGCRCSSTGGEGGLHKQVTVVGLDAYDWSERSYLYIILEGGELGLEAVTDEVWKTHGSVKNLIEAFLSASLQNPTHQCWSGVLQVSTHLSGE